MGRSAFDRLRVLAIHKLRGITPEEIEVPKPKYPATPPQMITARTTINNEQKNYQYRVMQQLSSMLMETLVDKGFVNFHEEDSRDHEYRTIRADIWVVRKDGDYVLDCIGRSGHEIYPDEHKAKVVRADFLRTKD